MTDPVVTVRGDARLQGPPDLATLNVVVHSTGPDADRVRAELARASAQVRQILQEHEAALDSSNTSRLHVAPVFKQRGTKITGYEGTFSTTVVVQDLTAISDLVYALAPLPNAQLDGPWWSLRPDNALYRQARLAAIDDARQRAADYAEAFGGTVGEVREISDLDGGMGWMSQAAPMRRVGKMAMAADEPEFDVEPAVQEVSGQVTVRFALVPPG